MGAELLTKAEFGRLRGLSPTRIKRLIAEGLPTRNGKVPLVEATAWLAANLDASRKNNWSDVSLNELRRQREQIKVVQGKLALARSRGDLVEQAAVTRFLTQRARQERDAWLAWASAAAGRLAAALAVDHGKLFAALESEVRLHLQHLADSPLKDEDADADAA